MQSRDVYKVIRNRCTYLYTYTCTYILTLYVCIICMYVYAYMCISIIHRRRDVETSKRFSASRIGFTFRFFSNDRAAPVDAALLILCTTYTHTSRIRYTKYKNNLYYYITLKIFIRNIDIATSHDEKLSSFSSIYLILTYRLTISLPYHKNTLQKSNAQK